MTEISDEIIMSRVKNGNLTEMSILFERYHVKLYNFMLRLTFDRTVSHDLTQNLFYRLIRYRHTYKEGNSFRSWIYQMARNIHIDYCNRQQKENERFEQVADYDLTHSEEKEQYNEEEYSRLEKALSKLDPSQKELIIMSRFQGLKYEEISNLRNATVSAIKVQMHRAIKELRQVYFKLI